MTQILSFRKMKLPGTLSDLSHLSPPKIKLVNSSGKNVQTKFCIVFSFSEKIGKNFFMINLALFFQFLICQLKQNK